MPARLFVHGELHRFRSGPIRRSRRAPGPEAAVEQDRFETIQGPIHFGFCACPAWNGSGRAPQGRSSATTTSGTSASASTLPVVSLQTLADDPTTGYGQESGTDTRKDNLTSAG
jgi:hypothetical protein